MPRPATLWKARLEEDVPEGDSAVVEGSAGGAAIQLAGMLVPRDEPLVLQAPMVKVGLVIPFARHIKGILPSTFTLLCEGFVVRFCWFTCKISVIRSYVLLSDILV